MAGFFGENANNLHLVAATCNYGDVADGRIVFGASKIFYLRAVLRGGQRLRRKGRNFC